jgi:hypothetical protein
VAELASENENRQAGAALNISDLQRVTAMGSGFKRLLQVLPVMVVLGTAAGSAQSRSLEIVGTAGYLSEWELSGALTERISAGGIEFFGPLAWKHVGLCSVNGPQEKYGEIKFQLSSSGSPSRINAMLSLGGAQCSYSGDFFGSSTGHMDCSDAKGVPLSISIK